MARNNYFKVSNRESDLFEQLVIEQVRIYGFDVHYIFRKFQNLDSLFGEDPISEFNKSFQVEMFVSNYEFFETQGKFIDKFGINLQDSVTLMVPKKRFEEEAARFGTETRPQEGDIIYFPEYGGLYEIKYVGSRNSFFSYELSCELFRYSGEDISTEILEVDEIEDKLITNIKELKLSGLSGSFYVGESIYQGSSFGNSSYSAILLDFNKTTGIAQVHSETGTISSIPPIRGEKSLAFAFYDSAQSTNRKFINNNTDDTAKIESERAQKDIIDFSDIDPFSEGNF